MQRGNCYKFSTKQVKLIENIQFIRNKKTKSTALAAPFRFCTNLTPMRLANRPGDGQTEAAAAGMPRAGLLLAAKAFKHFR